MAQPVFEWLRAADLNPDDAMVTARTKSVQDLEEKIRDSKTFGMLANVVDAVVGGCERGGEQSLAFTTLLECVRTQSAAFPSALAENGLHLRIVGCLGLRQLLTSNKDDVTNKDELLAAS